MSEPQANARDAPQVAMSLLDELRAVVGAAQRAGRRRSAGVRGRLAQALPRPRARRGAAGLDRRGRRGRARLRARTARRSSPQGGNTGLVGGSVPDASGAQVVLSLPRMNRVRAIDAANLDDDGRGRLRAADACRKRPRAAGLLFPLSLAAEGSCTIGGNLATNAGGTQVLRYGNARELCLGLEVVTAAGRDLGRPDAACARTTPATTCATSSSAAKARSASSPRRR